jgi:hypothetical protein
MDCRGCPRFVKKPNRIFARASQRATVKFQVHARAPSRKRSSGKSLGCFEEKSQSAGTQCGSLTKFCFSPPVGDEGSPNQGQESTLEESRQDAKRPTQGCVTEVCGAGIDESSWDYYFDASLTLHRVNFSARQSLRAHRVKALRWSAARDSSA